LKLLDHVQQRFPTPVRCADTLPGEIKARKRWPFHGFDFPSEACERLLAQRSQYARVAPFPTHASRPEFALDKPTGRYSDL
jgi:hypothetical protein